MFPEIKGISIYPYRPSDDEDSQKEWSVILLRVPEMPTISATPRLPIHLCCVVDTSTSTADSLPTIKRTLFALAELLGPDDRMSLITFSKNTTMLLNNLYATHRPLIHKKIAMMCTESSCNLSAGIADSHSALLALSTHFKQSIVLLTGGHVDDGLTNTKEINELVKHTTKTFGGTTLHCVGYGENQNAELLAEISRVGGGAYYRLRNPNDIPLITGDIVGGMASCEYQNVGVILPRGIAVRSTYPIQAFHANQEVMIGDLVAGKEVAIIAQIPRGFLFTVRGQSMQTHRSFLKDCGISKGSVQDHQQALTHYYRIQLVYCMRDMLKGKLVAEFLHHFKERFEYHLDRIYDPIWRIMLDDVQYCLQPIINRSIVIQHQTCLASLKGIAAADGTHKGYDLSNEMQRVLSRPLRVVHLDEDVAPHKRVYQAMLEECANLNDTR